MFKDFLDSIIDSIFDEEWKGRRGEKLTESELKWVRIFGHEGITLRNLYVPKTDGGTSEIDLVYITQKGIFVFESKNYSGWIFGNERNQYWTVCYPNGDKNRFYNPIRQNQTHIRYLQQYIGRGIPLFSIIVFSERCELKSIIVESSAIKVIKRDATYAAVRDIWSKHPNVLSEQQKKEICEKLKVLIGIDASVKAAHVNDIMMKQNALSKQERGEKICPWCGKSLVLRTAKQGAYAGKRFYGCRGFPKC